MPAEIEERLAALELPPPDPAFEARLRTAVVPRRRRRSPRMLALAVVAFVCLASAVAFGASRLNDDGVRLTRHTLASGAFRVDPTRSVANRKVAVALDCRLQGRMVACTPLPSPSRMPSAYHLVQRAGTAHYGPLTLVMFATGSTIFSAVEGMPPLVACPLPSAMHLQICEPLTSRSVLPRGTPIYQDVSGP